MPESLRCDLNLVGHLHVVIEPQALAFGGLAARFAKRLEKRAVLEDVDRLLERLEVLGRHENGRRPSVACHDESLVLPRRPVYELRQVRFRLGERDRLAHDWSEF